MISLRDRRACVPRLPWELVGTLPAMPCTERFVRLDSEFDVGPVHGIHAFLSFDAGFLQGFCCVGRKPDLQGPSGCRFVLLRFRLCPLLAANLVADLRRFRRERFTLPDFSSFS